MSFRGAFGEGRLVARPLPKVSLTARLAATIASGADALERPNDDLDTVAKRFISDIERGAKPPLSDWNRIAWCLWETKPAVAQNDKALNAVLGRVASTDRKRPYRQLASAYLGDFEPQRLHLARVAQVLATRAPMAGEPWQNSQAEYGLFDGVVAVARIARVAISRKMNAQEMLSSLDISGGLLEAGFAEAVTLEGLRALMGAKLASATEHLDTIRRWCFRPNGSLIFSKSRADMARALVAPFGDTVPDVIAQFLIDQFGDPRTRPASWIGLDDIAEKLRRWLTGQSLRQFFDVVDRVAHPSQWKYRRAFWTAIYEADLIRDSWVVFGPDGAAEAIRSFGKNSPFGTFRKLSDAKQIERNHAVLLMDLGQCFVADWSHNGRCNIWSMEDPKKPHLHKQQYTSSEVMRRVLKDQSEANLNRHDMFSHVGSDTYVWQDRVSRRIYELVGIRVQKSDYRIS